MTYNSYKVTNARIPIYVTLELKVIEHGDDVHNEQQLLAPCVVHVTAIDNVYLIYIKKTIISK